MSTTAEQSPPRPKSPQVVVEGIPSELRERPRWVCWRYEYRNGKWTKIPLVARTGANASTTDPKTWSTFDVALAAFYNQAFPCDGIGIALGDGLAGIDLDDCLGVEGFRQWALDIINECPTYGELSPSGEGVKLFCFGGLPTSGTGTRRKLLDGLPIPDGGEVEVYQHGRYFTITGQRLPDLPEHLADCCSQLHRLYGRIKAEPAQKNGHANGYQHPDIDDDGTPAPETTSNGHAPTDQDIIDKAKGARNGRKFEALWNGDTNAYGNDDSAADLGLCGLLAFWTGPDPVRIDKLFRQSGLVRDKWTERQDYRDATITLAIDGRTKFFDWSKQKAKRQKKQSAATRAEGDERPEIEVTPEEHEVNAQAAAAIAADPDTYCRGGVLVRLVRDPGGEREGIWRPEGGPRIDEMPLPIVRERLTAAARFVRRVRTEQGNILVRTTPPAACINAVAARGTWPGMRWLSGVVSFPVLRYDGTILAATGYDSKSGLIFEPACPFPPVPERPTAEQVAAAVVALSDIVCDFPFATPNHRSAWIAFALTPLARYAFRGPAPLFLIDANTRGSGKSLLTDAVSIYLTGLEMPRMTYPGDDAEMRKAITSIAIAGDSLILLDNLARDLGCASLDAALTGTVWKDRVLGSNRTVQLPLTLTWCASGNNVVLAADTARRVLHIRLESPMENPEERGGFRHPDLLAWIREERARLVAAGLTILRGYCAAGRPSVTFKPWGSFEGWSNLVRAAIVWAGLPDPGETRQELMQKSDRDATSLRALLLAWHEFDDSNRGWTAAELVRAVTGDKEHPIMEGSKEMSLRDALLELCPAKNDEGKINPRSVGNKLRRLRGRVCNGMVLDDRDEHGKCSWFVREVTE